jgi:hypothetical protein
MAWSDPEQTGAQGMLLAVVSSAQARSSLSSGKDPHANMGALQAGREGLLLTMSDGQGKIGSTLAAGKIALGRAAITHAEGSSCLPMVQQIFDFLTKTAKLSGTRPKGFKLGGGLRARYSSFRRVRRARGRRSRRRISRRAEEASARRTTPSSPVTSPHPFHDRFTCSLDRAGLETEPFVPRRGAVPPIRRLSSSRAPNSPAGLLPRK